MIATADKISRRLHIYDKTSGAKLSIDAGSDVSLVPRPAGYRCEAHALRLFSANDSLIDTYSSLRRELNLGLRRSIKWDLIVANVLCAIIGADLLYYHSLSIDLRRKMLIDHSSKLRIKVGSSEVSTISVSHPAPNINFGELLTQFPKISRVEPPTPVKNKGVFYDIITNGPLVAQRTRRVHSKKYLVVKTDYRRLCEAGTCRPSNNLVG